MAVVPYVRATHSDGQSWSAAKANLLEAGVNDVSYAPAVRVTHNAAQSITTSTDTALAFNTERFDQAGNAADTQHDTVTNNSRLTCRYAGVYQITGMVEWAADAAAASNRIVKIRWSSGPTFIAESQIRCATTIALQQNVSTLYALAVNEYVELVVWHDKGSSLNVNVTGNFSPEFGMVRVG